MIGGSWRPLFLVLSGLFFWADTVGAASVLERLKPYAELGKRFEPTTMLLEHAKKNRKFYE